MSQQPGQEEDPPVERGGSEEASGAPLTPTEEETSSRPAGVTPGVTPGSDPDVDAQADDATYQRRKESNPDDFE
jgi:hypothetical protein